MKRQFLLVSVFAMFLGAAAIAGFAPLRLFWAPVLTTALLLRIWRNSASPFSAAWLGFCHGLGFFLAGISWVYISLHDTGGMSSLLAAMVTLGFCAFLALFHALVGYAYTLIANGGGARSGWLSNCLLFAGLWTWGEWLRGWVFSGFPWLAAGYAHTPPSPLADYAPIIGVFGIGLLASLLSSLMALGWRYRFAWLSIALILVVGLLLRASAWSQPLGDPVTVSLLQGNVPQSLKWQPQHVALSFDVYRRLALDNPAQLTVLPETAFPVLLSSIPDVVLRDLSHHGEALLGIIKLQGLSGHVNSMVALPERSADFTQSYAKRHLLPFGEFAPPGFDWLFKLVNIPMSDFSRGNANQPLLQVAGQKIAATICYEDLFGDELLPALPEATMLINASNTAWFGDSLAQPQHLQISQMRALETGRMMLRAGNTGITAAISPKGQVIKALPAFTSGALLVMAQGMQGITPFMLWANAMALLLATAMLIPSLVVICRHYSFNR